MGCAAAVSFHKASFHTFTRLLYMLPAVCSGCVGRRNRLGFSCTAKRILQAKTASHECTHQPKRFTHTGQYAHVQVSSSTPIIQVNTGALICLKKSVSTTIRVCKCTSVRARPVRIICLTQRECLKAHQCPSRNCPSKQQCLPASHTNLQPVLNASSSRQGFHVNALRMKRARALSAQSSA